MQTPATAPSFVLRSVVNCFFGLVKSFCSDGYKASVFQLVKKVFQQGAPLVKVVDQEFGRFHQQKRCLLRAAAASQHLV